MRRLCRLCQTGSQHVPDVVVVVIGMAQWVIARYFDEDFDGADLDERSLSSQVASQEMASMNPSSAAQMLKAVFLLAFSGLSSAPFVTHIQCIHSELETDP